ncbi:hypothetical protein BH10PLA1_BH10PLA1_21150 [soil metagenome]
MCCPGRRRIGKTLLKRETLDRYFPLVLFVSPLAFIVGLQLFVCWRTVCFEFGLPDNYRLETHVTAGWIEAETIPTDFEYRASWPQLEAAK